MQVLDEESPMLPGQASRALLDLSLVIPVRDEAENLAALEAALLQALHDSGEDWEAILVDDGSSDGSWPMLLEMARRNPAFRAIRLRRNYGQTAAMVAGFRTARGAVVIAMDADLQNDPADIPLLLAKIREGCDVVSGWRVDRKDGFFTRLLPSRMANWLISRLTGTHLHDYGCSLKAYRADLLRELHLYGDAHRFIPAYAAMEGAKVVEIPVRHHPRRAGRTKYGLSRTFRVLLDLLVVRFLLGYRTRPMHIFGGFGLSLCGAGVLAGVISLVQRIFFDVRVHRNPLILLAVFLFILGVLCLMMGLLAELQIRVYHEATGKPIYSVSEDSGPPALRGLRAAAPASPAPGGREPQPARELQVDRRESPSR